MPRVGEGSSPDPKGWLRLGRSTGANRPVPGIRPPEELAPGVLRMTPDVADVLTSYDRAHGFTEYVLVDAELSDLQAVEAALLQLRIRARPSWVDFDIEKAEAVSITLEQFVGRGYDFDTGRLVSARQEPLLGCGDSSFTDAYAEAFSEAPHGISLQNPRVAERCIEWFAFLNRELLGGLTQDLEIMQWTTDWSSWFDAGHEWWGSFMWSVRPPDRNWTVIIAASATD